MCTQDRLITSGDLKRVNTIIAIYHLITINLILSYPLVSIKNGVRF